MATIQDMDMTILARSLKLLHSPDEDSAEQLRLILEETIKNKYGNRKPINLTGLGLNKKMVTADDMTNKSKRIKLEERNRASPFTTLDESQTSDSDSDDGVALEILDDDLSCVVCHEMAVGAGNNLVECVECHSLYHQECHNPPITQDVNDPRFVWYCANCTKTMNKVASSSKGSPSSISQSGKQPKAVSKSSSTSSSSKSFSAFSSSSSGKSSGSSYSSKSSGSGSGSHQSSSKSSTIPVPKINTITAADKRLQIMKKNAAKKQEKRKLPK